ncbi:MAG TPA: sigma-70 family RNA polymerase sigma factor [Roseiflexaceae bacterium]|nr:sigma-70 family RNA polymerase sigma factor [Roseiflexaceae bacterium]
MHLIRQPTLKEGSRGVEQADVLNAELTALRDDDLIRLVVRRDEQALGVLYDRYIRLVYAVALRVTGDRETAEEVVQDVFQAVWQSAGGFQPGVASFSSWLLGIARHRAIDATRSKRERARTREHALDPAMPSGDDSSPEREAGRRALRDVVREALGALPTNQRRAIELAYYGGLTRDEIARATGEPVGTIKTRLRLGLLKLRDLLGPHSD